MTSEAELFHVRPGPRREQGRTDAGFPPGAPERLHERSLAAGPGPKCAKQSQFSGRDCFPRLREGRLASLLAMTAVRLGPIVSNEPNFAVSGLGTRVGWKTNPIPPGRAGPLPPAGRVRQTNPICGGGRLPIGDWRFEAEGRGKPVMSNKPNFPPAKMQHGGKANLCRREAPDGGLEIRGRGTQESSYVKQTQFPPGEDAARRNGGCQHEYNSIKRKGLHATRCVLCGSVVNR